MQFSIPLSLLRTPLDAVISVVDRSASLEITTGVLIRTTNNQLSVTATNLQVEMTCRQNLTVELPDIAVSLPGHKLESLCKSFPGDAILDCEIDESSFTIKSGGFSGSLKTTSAETFPLMENAAGQDDEVSMNVEAEDLHKLMEKVAYAIAVQDVRFFLNGMRVEVSDQGVVCIATDGHRMALGSLEGDYRIEKPGSFTIPRRGVVEVMKVLARNAGRAQWQVSNNNLLVKSDQLAFQCKLIEGEFPNYKAAIPASPTNALSLENARLISAVERISILSNEKPRGIKLGFGPDGLTLSTQNSQGEKAHDQLAVAYTGEERNVGFNVEYLLAALRKIETQQVRISFDSNSEGFRLEEDNGSDLLAVIMPMKV